MKNNVKKRSTVPIVGDMIFSLLTLPSAMGYIKDFFTNPENPDLLLYLASTFVVMGIARLFRAFRYRPKSRLQFIKFLVFGSLMIFCSFLGVLFDQATTTRILAVVYLGSLIADRVISCYLNRGMRNLVLNGVAIFLLIWTLVVMFRELHIVFVLMIIAVLHALVSILSVTFSRINLKSLANVARETYAAEIIGGLLLLIFAFAYILSFVEPNMASLKDGLWYCFAIVTTIGFGDVTATTTVGRILSVILGMYGIVVVALITSVIVNYYGEMKRENAEEKKL